MIDEKQLDKIQKLGVYHRGVSVKPEPLQGGELPPSLSPTGFDAPHQFDKPIEPSNVIELVDTSGFKVHGNTDIKRALPTLLILVLIGCMFQGKIDEYKLKSTLTAVAIIAIPLAILTNR